MRQDSKKHDETRGGPFAEAAPELLANGLVTIPCNGKRPLLKGWQRASLTEIRAKLPGLTKRFGKANVGLSCGASQLVVVDIDASHLLDAMLDRFGPTPLIVRSPRLGFHLYYREGSYPIRCQNLRHQEGLEVDIKADGGLVIAPPSTDPKTGQQYIFHVGMIDCLNALPVFRIEALDQSATNTDFECRFESRFRSQIPRGRRNDDLFKELLKHAPHCDDFDALLDVAQTRNEFAFEAPLPDREVVSTAKSAWRYEQDGRNWVGRSSRTILSRNELVFFASHKNGGDALLLWAYLEGQHALRGAPLALDRKAMAKADILPGWSEWRYRVAIESMRELGLLTFVSDPRRRRDATFAPHQYQLNRPVAVSRQNATGTGFVCRKSSK